jgi:polysaccharide export outer membrane protein
MKRPNQYVLGLSLLICVFIPGTSKAQTDSPAKVKAENANVAASAKTSTSPVAARNDESFVIGSDDLLAISVWKEPDLTKQLPVRSDGMISFPLIGELQAAGRTPSQLQHEITSKLKNYISEPEVSVVVQEIRSLKINILGQVTKPGAYPLTADMTIVDAIAAAGGFRDFAKTKGVYVLRKNSAGGVDSRFAFNYQDFIKGKNTEQNIGLKSRDTIVVP